MKKQIIVWILLLGAISCQQVCKRFVCTSKKNQPANQINDTFCMNEQTSVKELYKVYTYYDMCAGTIWYWLLIANQYCSYYSVVRDDTQADTIYSVCRSQAASPLIFTPTISYPGEACDTYGVLYECAYGKKL